MNVSVTAGNDSLNLSKTVYFFNEKLIVFTNPDLLTRTVAIYLSGSGRPICPKNLCMRHKLQVVHVMLPFWLYAEGYIL